MTTAPNIAADNAARGSAALADRLAAEAAGFKFDGTPWFAYGTELIDVGKNAWREQRAALDALPLASDMLDNVAAAVAAENRRDFDIPVSALRMRADGLMYNGHADLQGLAFNEHAFRQFLCARAGAPGAAASYLPTLPTDIMAPAVNHHLATARTEKGEIPRAMLRTKNPVGANGRRSVYAAVSPTFERYDVDQVAAALAGIVHPTARGKAILNGARWELQAQFGAPVEPVVGDVFNAMLSITGADDGSRRLRVQVAMEQVRCVNLTRLNASIEIGDGVMHRGKQLAEKIAAAIKEGYGKIESFVERWADAAKSEIVFGMNLGVEQVFAVLLANGHIARPGGMSAEDFVAACTRAYWEAPEYGLTQRGVSYAVTKAAQSLAPWAAAEVEEQAGELLYNYVVINPGEFDSAQRAAKGTALASFLEID